MPAGNQLEGMVDSGKRCTKCGYNLTGLKELRCPECGSDFQLEEVRSAFEVKERRKALAALALLALIALVSTLGTLALPSGGSMMFGGIFVFPFMIFLIAVNGFGIILGIAGVLSRPYRYWYVVVLTLILINVAAAASKIL